MLKQPPERQHPLRAMANPGGSQDSGNGRTYRESYADEESSEIQLQVRLLHD
jgi:hypothetical protein